MHKCYLKKCELLISLWAVLICLVQVYAFFCQHYTDNHKAVYPVLEVLFDFMPIQFVLVFLIQLIPKQTLRYVLLIIFLGSFWFFINREEFILQVANWSTFSEREVLFYVFIDSTLPMTVGLVVFSFCYFGWVNVISKAKQDKMIAYGLAIGVALIVSHIWLFIGFPENIDSHYKGFYYTMILPIFSIVNAVFMMLFMLSLFLYEKAKKTMIIGYVVLLVIYLLTNLYFYFSL